MVKPALPYLDVIQDAAQLAPDHPLACYQVSGEYAMVVAGARAGVYDNATAAMRAADGAGLIVPSSCRMLQCPCEVYSQRQTSHAM